MPCKTYGPIVEEVTKRLGTQVEKIDIDERWNDVPTDVRSVPTIIMEDKGKEISRIIGARPADALSDWILNEGD